ncbi:MAG: hypothetical protein R3C49_26575 [Planctomycetaceae bacterium]
MPYAETCLGFGAIVSAIGISLVCYNVKAYRVHLRNTDLSRADEGFYSRQYSRRMQTSALAVTLGALIGLCGYLKAFRESHVFATIYLTCLLLLSLWLMLLAVSDVLATRVYAGRTRRTQGNLQGSLQQALDDVRKAHGLSSPER